MIWSSRIGLVIAAIALVQHLTAWQAIAVSEEGTLLRADLLRYERRVKAEKLEKPERATIEKGLIGLNKFLRLGTKLEGGLKGFHYTSGHFPAGAGFAYGVGFSDLAVGSLYKDADLSNRFDVNVSFTYSTSQYLRGRTDLSLRNIGGTPFNLSFLGQYYEFPQEDFFGFGRLSLEDDRTSYRLDSWEIGGELSWEPTKWLRTGGGAFHLSPRTGSGEDDRFPSVEELIDPAMLPGFQANPDFIRIDGWLHLDWRDNPSHTRAGSLARLRLSNYRDQNLDSFDFHIVEIEAQHYIPWLQKYRVLALRANVVISDIDSGNNMPFYYMPTLGGADKLRGFREFRFRDHNSILFSAEYRWEAWWALDMALFVDSGKVVSDRNDLNFADLEISSGLGFRMHSTESFVMRFDLAFSRERFIPFLRYDNAF